MKRQSTFTEKLKSYSLLTSGILASAAAANAQVIYTDIFPDFVGNVYSDYQLDLNNDGVFDFWLDQNYNTYFVFYGSCISFNRIWNTSFTLTGYGNCDSCLRGSDEIGKLNSGDTIDSTPPWFEGATLRFLKYHHFANGTNCGDTFYVSWSTANTFAEGNWVGAVDQYVGIRIFKDDHFYYGWIRMSVDTNTFTVKDYAYATLPDMSIAAGDIGCVIPSNLTELNIKTTSARLTWDAITGVDGYRLRYKEVMSNNWSIAISNIPSKKLKNMLPGTGYVWQVEAICESSENLTSDWSKPEYFHTAQLRTEEAGDMSSVLQLFPNPTAGTFTLDLKLDDEENSQVIIQVLNMLGQVVYDETTSVTNGALQKEIQLRDAANGMYMVKVTVGDEVFSSQISYQK